MWSGLAVVRIMPLQGVHLFMESVHVFMVCPSSEMPRPSRLRNQRNAQFCHVFLCVSPFIWL